MEPSNSSIVDSLVRDAVVTLFADYGQSLTAVELPILEDDGILFCGVLGFTGDNARGTMLLATTRQPLGATNPTDGALRDWIAELTNQLLGRIKHRLSAYGCTIFLSTPVVLSGRHLAPLPRQELLPIAYRAQDGGMVCIWFELELHPGCELAATPAPASDALTEGDALLF